MRSTRRSPIRRRTARSGASPARGQSLVEFALVLTPLMLVLLGIIQFGFIFNSYVTMTNAVREGARTGTIYVYDTTLGSKAANDLSRNNSIKNAVLASMNLLGKTAPQFTTGSTWTQSSSSNTTTFTNGDLTIKYDWSGASDTDTRRGEQVTATAAYHQDLVVPLIANLLPRDTGGRLRLTTEVTMVIN